MFAAPPPVSAAPSAVQTAVPAARYGFGGGEMGMDFATWRASTPEAAAAPCSVQGAVQTCALVSPSLGGGYSARDLTFTFMDGRLAAIDFKSSIDGFDYATAALKRRFGAPTQILRNEMKATDGMYLPHVQMTWKNGRSTIRLDDPTRSSLAVSVRLSLDADAARLPPSPA